MVFYIKLFLTKNKSALILFLPLYVMFPPLPWLFSIIFLYQWFQSIQL